MKKNEMNTSLLKCRLLDKIAFLLFSISIFNISIIQANIQNTDYAQARNIEGIVKDKQGEPLIGVSVIVKGLQNGTMTGIDGKFTLQASPSDILVISYIGFITKEVLVGDKYPIEIVLDEDNKLLDEVVVVGFATQKKVNLTGSVSTIGSKELESIPVSNAALALQGQLPGLTITRSSGQLYGKNPNMQLRGLATIGQGSSGSVLVLIDGMEGDINTLNPQDIENISILKDAAASSIYGSRAPFGVILVTTKKGKSGKTSINYNNNFRFNTPINMPKMADSYSWALYFNDAANNDGNGDDIGPARLQRIKDYMDGKISYNTIPVGGQWGTAYTEGNDNIDYYDVFYKNRTTAQEHNLSINGGSENINYFVSGNFVKEDGLLNWDLDGLKRYNIFGKIDGQVSKILNIKYSTRFIREDYHQPRVMSDEIFQYFGQYLWPVGPLYDPNGFLFNDTSLRFKDGGQNEYSNTTSSHQFGAVLEPIKGWRFVGELNYRYRSFFTHSEVKEVYQMSVDGITPGSKWDDHTGVSEYVFRDDYINFNAYTDFERTINSHYFKLMGGFQAEQLNNRSVYAQKEGLIVPDIATIDTASGLYNGTSVSPNVSGGYARWRTVGFFGRLNYNYKEKYLFEANLRYDGSSRFRNNERWGLFPSLSIGYNIAKESFFNALKTPINTFKFRASYGSLGNQNTTSIYPTYEAMGFANSAGKWLINGQKPNIAWPPALISSSLSWEEIRSWNAGLDFGLLNNRLTGSFDYFIRKTLNMVGPADELPVILGTSVPYTNNTDLQTKGFELEISWRDVAFKHLNYGVRFTLSDAQAEITRYSNPSGTLSKFYKGMKWGETWGYESVGIARTDEEMEQHIISLYQGGQSALGARWQAGDVMYKDLNGDNKIDAGAYTINDHGDLKVIGNTQPRYTFGMDLTAEWKGLDFRMFLQGVGKKDYFQGSKYFFGSNGSSKWGTMVLTQHTDYFRNDPDHPLGLNVDSYYPRPYLDNNKNYQTQSLFIQNAAYMRIKNLQIGYTLPTKAVSKAGMSKVRVYLSGENLYTFTNMSDLFDPELIDGNSQGNVYPLTRTYSVGLNITF